MKRKIYELLSAAKPGFFILVLAVFSATAYAQTTYTFNYTGGQQTMSLPAGTYTIETWGADGGDNLGNSSTTYLQNGGKGGYSRGTYTLASTTTVYVNVGGAGGVSTSSLNVIVPGGYNGGGYGSLNSTSGKSSGASGGGASHVATASGTLGALVSSSTTAVIIVAGGGGGAGECNYLSNNTQYNSNGGNGGGISGLQNPSTSYQGRHGQGGTQTAGGGGGDNISATAGPPLQGIFGVGGYNTATGANTSAGGAGIGGGGGGWFGGGAGWGGAATGFQAGSGGGGSGYIGGVTNGTTIVFGQSGFVTKPIVGGDGLVLITELCSMTLYAVGPTNSLTPSICAGQSTTLMTNAISNYSWSTGATTSSLVVSPTTNTVYALTATSPSNCTTTRNISIIVSSGLPVLSIANPSNNICLGRTVSLTATGALTYTWTNPGVVNGQTFTPTSTTAYTVTGQNGCGTTVSTTTITVAPLAVSVLASPTLVCQGYPSTLTAVSAVNGFTWQPNSIPGSTTIVAPVANTVYTVTASDGTCSGTATLAVATKQTPTITTSATFTNMCEGSQSILTASGASTYTWNPGNLSGNTITVSPATSTLYVVNGINSVGCESTAQQIILVMPAPPVTVAANKTLTCSGEPLVLSAGGAGTYSWTNGPQSVTYTVFPTGPSDYTVTGIGSNGCTKTRTISVSAVVPNVVVPSSVAICVGKSATITASGATTYSWNGFNLQSPSYIILPTTNTVVILTANTSSLTVNCITSHSINVTVNANPTVNVVATKTTVCRNQPTTLSASGALNYNWGTLGTTASVVVSPSVQTNYTVSGVDANGCENIGSFIVKVLTCAGIDEMNAATNAISVYPNPTHGAFTIKAASAIELRLVNELGQQLMLIDLNADNNFKANVEGLSNGVYFIVGRNETGVVNQKIVIAK